MPALFGTRRAQRIAQSQEQARQDLALRAEALAQQLSSCGLTCQRLTNTELALLYYECLTPDRASAHPLSDDILSSVGRPTRAQRHSQSIAQSHIVRTTVGGENHATERGPALKTPPAVLAVAAPAQAPPAQREDAPSPPQPDLLHLVDLLAPECIEITPDALRIGQDYACGIAVTACPREVSFDGWLAPLFLHDEVLDISFHYHPQDTAAMKRQLQRNRAGPVSGRRLKPREGRPDDSDELCAQEDLTRILDDLARNRERGVDLGFYLLLRASNRQGLAEP